MLGKLYLPGQGECGAVPVCPLGELGGLGYDVRDVHDAFRKASGETDYPAFWNHDTRRVTKVQQAANQWLQALGKPKPGRKLRGAAHIWERAGRLLIAERLRFNTMRLAAARLEQNVLSNVWWSFVPAREPGAAAVEKCLALWLNSTLGFIMLMGHREETEGAWNKFKKPVLKQLPVLDPRELSAGQRAALVRAYDQLATRDLLPFPYLETDEVRAAVDAAIADALDLPDLAGLRRSLSREPVICLNSTRLLS